MYCTTCQIITNDLSHYKSEIHCVNLKRKINGLPPLTLEELYPESRSDDISLDLYHDNTEVDSFKNFPKENQIKKKKCLFCEQDESQKHYLEHGLSYEQIAYVNHLQCYICYERFVRQDHLLDHLKADIHRSAVTDGVSLYLMNGKVLNPDKKLIPVIPSQQIEEKEKTQSIEDHYYNKLKDIEEVNKLKIGKLSNRNFRKKPI